MANADDRDSPAGEPLPPGLYLVATPIGNLEDITLRALRILRDCDLIACEDTRHTRRLLDHYGIATPTVSYHEHNERERAVELSAALARGKRVALVSDAGMPGISDPGYRIVRLAIEHGIRVVPVPGATAIVAALAAAGLPTDDFRFRGFLPARAGARRTLLESLRDSDITEVFYEAPHRLLEALQDVVAALGCERPVVLARELTKIHEEFLRGSAAEVLSAIESRGERKGECVLLVGKAAPGARSAAQSSVRAQFDALLEQGLSEKAAMKKLAKELGLSRDELFRELQRRKA